MSLPQNLAGEIVDVWVTSSSAPHGQSRGLVHLLALLSALVIGTIRISAALSRVAILAPHPQAKTNYA
ncbi:MAG: hypothetical protein JO117_05565 [Verrucomicrobia bacterium]|nr:hypothetical protein [Verrucomicrobiota bacterium]